MVNTPKTLHEAVLHFSDHQNCLDYMIAVRWPNGVTCPVCGSKSVRYLARVNRFQCSKAHAKRQFTVKTGTIFEDSPLGLDRWLIALWLITNAKNGISSYEIKRALGVTQKTAWFMLHRIRLAMQKGSFDKLGGKDGLEIEADETFIGGRARNMHADVKERRGISQAPMSGKTVVMGILERTGEVRTFQVETTKRTDLVPVIQSHVKKDSWLYTDANPSYFMLTNWYRHETVDHAVEYVSGRVHTNGMENFWSLLKRTLNGTYVSVEPFHLFRYLDEQSFRYNERKDDDSGRFYTVCSQVAGRRLTYAQLTGKTFN